MPLFPDGRLTAVERSESGLACLAACSWIFGDRGGIARLRSHGRATAGGLSVRELLETAEHLQLTGRRVSCATTDLRSLRCPAILQLADGQYVVLRRLRARSRADIFDPNLGWRRATFEELGKTYTGVAVEVQPQASFLPGPPPPSLPLRALLTWQPAYMVAAFQIVTLSFILQCCLLAAPLYLGLVLDEVLPTGDAQLLVALFLGFSLLAVFSTATTILRGLATQRIQSVLSWEMTRRVFRHVMRLPLRWFEQRRLSDSIVRMQSIEHIKAWLSNGAITVVVDGLMSLATLGMMTVLSPSVAIAATLGFVAVTVTRIVFIPLSTKYSRGVQAATIAQQGKLIETLRSIQTVKVMAGEFEREAEWSDRLVEQIHRTQELGSANTIFSATQNLASGVTAIAIVLFGAMEVMSGDLSIGLLTAVITYQVMFQQRATAVLEQYVAWKMLVVHRAQVAELVLEPTEAGWDGPDNPKPMSGGAIQVSNLSYRYARSGPNVLHDVSFDVRAGEYVALVGASGAGKSTLLKLLCGLYEPTSGSVRIDGASLDDGGARGLRKSLGIVLQNDEVFGGTIAENVSFFSDNIKIEEVWNCLELSGLRDEVVAMPKGIHAEVGEFGSNMSGGQKQRLLLARALYRNPSLLILDEATSHLDVERERQILETLKSRNVTRIIAAHRPETIASADRVIRLVRTPHGATIASE